MNKISYSGYRFPPEILHRAIWLYLRFTLSFRDVEDLLSERGVTVSYETVRRWVNYFGPRIASVLRKRRPRHHSTWHLDEIYTVAWPFFGEPLMPKARFSMCLSRRNGISALR